MQTLCPIYGLSTRCDLYLVVVQRMEVVIAGGITPKGRYKISVAAMVDRSSFGCGLAVSITLSNATAGVSGPFGRRRLLFGDPQFFAINFTIKCSICSYQFSRLIALGTPGHPTKLIFLSGERVNTGACEGASYKDEFSIALKLTFVHRSNNQKIRKCKIIVWKHKQRGKSLVVQKIKGWVDTNGSILLFPIDR
ncbi:hypothetical protein PROFUN_02154 [Planoprotostelium fungivorum]|uniref:Uncharacterized protein n=1 Tax=Planoprotostelium fungivorum TaxID=1890364 RepID=A0A2P6NZA3_9EUKA|nr:hypothetical protein PROFUN_02154 [Planoprotostelium fungivorum]